MTTRQKNADPNPVGRPRKRTDLKKTPRLIKLEDWLWHEIDRIGPNRAVCIRDAILHKYKLKIPA